MMTAWLFSRGLVAEQCAYSAKIGSVWDIIAEEAGGVMDEGMDAQRQELHTIYVMTHADNICTACGMLSAP